MYALKPPKVGGPDQLCLFVDHLGFAWACKAISVTPATMRRWMKPDGKPPIHALQSLYWLTKWGFSEACAEVHWSHQYLVGKVRELEAALAFKAPERRAANDPTFHQPPARARAGWAGGRRRFNC